jgi:predicted metal-dependent hydrolase
VHSVADPLVPLTVRRPGWEGIEGSDPMWNRAHVELVAGMNAVSLLMPHVEPLIAGAVRSRFPDLEPELADTARRFADQEIAHQSHHRAMNEVLRRRYRGLSLLERAIRRTYRWVGRRGPASTLTFAAASETLAHSLARWVAAHPAVLTHGSDGTWADGVWPSLYTWHLAEEVEHKSVAFDVWRALDARGSGASSRTRFFAWGLFSAVLVALFATWGALIQLFGERRLRNPLTWIRLAVLAVSVAFELLPSLAVASTRGHHPSDLADPSWFSAVLEGCDGPGSGPQPG